MQFLPLTFAYYKAVLILKWLPIRAISGGSRMEGVICTYVGARYYALAVGRSRLDASLCVPVQYLPSPRAVLRCAALHLACLISLWLRLPSSRRASKWRDGFTRAWALAILATAYHNLSCDPYPSTRGEEISRSKRTSVRASSLVAQHSPGSLVPACQPPVVPPPRGAQASETRRVCLEIASLALGPASQGVTHVGKA